MHINPVITVPSWLRRFSVFLCSLICLLSVEAASQESLSLAYEDLRAAKRDCNLERLEKLLSPDYILTDSQGAVISRAQMMRAWNADSTMLRPFEAFELTVTNVAFSLETAAADSLLRYSGRISVPGGHYPYAAETLTRDEWIKAPEGWRLARQRVMQVASGTYSGDSSRWWETPPLRSTVLSNLVQGIQKNGLGELDVFWQKQKERGPVIESVPGNTNQYLVTFLWRGSENGLQVSLPPDKKLSLEQVPGTDLWFHSETLPSDTRFQYAFVAPGSLPLLASSNGPANVRVNWERSDPLNTNRWDDKSVLQLPQAKPQAWWAKRPEMPSGELADRNMESRILGENRSFTVYLPAGFKKLKAKPGLLVLLDGEGCAPLLRAHVTLDNLIAEKKIPPTVAVFLNNQGKRFQDLGRNDKFAQFVAAELLPWLRDNYRVSSRASDVIISGLSLGGLSAAHIVYRYPDAVGGALIQSPTPDPNLEFDFISGKRSKVKFYIEAGTFESGLHSSARHLADVLRAKGHRVTFDSLSGAHDYVKWRGTLADGLIDLFKSSEEEQ